MIACACAAMPVAFADPPPQTPWETPPVAPAPPPRVTVSTMGATMPVFVREPEQGPPTGAWIATGVTGGLAIAALGWWAYSDHYIYGSRGNQAAGCVPNFNALGMDLNNCSAGNAGVEHRQHVWFDTEFAIGVATATAAVVAAYLWSHHEGTLHRVTVTPTPTGVAVSLGGRL